MRPVLWSAAARAELLNIVRFIAETNPGAATRVAERLEKAAAELGQFTTGRRGRVSGTYEKVIAGLPYIIAYAIDGADSHERGGSVVILHVIHGARDWREGGWPHD